MLFKKYLTIIFLLFTGYIIAGENQYFPNENTIQDSTVIVDESNGTKAIPNDQMPDKNISGSFRYSNKTGIVKYIVKEDESGSLHYVNVDNGEEVNFVDLSKKPQSLINAEKDYKEVMDNNESTVAEINKAKINVENEIDRYNHLGGLNVMTLERTVNATSARSAAGAMINGIFDSDKKNMTDQEKNMTSFLSKNFSSNPDLANKDKIDDTVSQLADVYQSYDKLQSELLSKEPGGSIKCFITRKLIPSYYCSYPDMQGAFYPKISSIESGQGISVSSADAKNMCESACYKKRGVISSTIFPIDEMSLIVDKDLKILPYSKSSALIDIPTRRDSRVAFVEYDIVITPKDENLSDKEFNKVLTSMRPSLKYRSSVSVLNFFEDSYKNIVKLRPTKILSNVIHQKISINETTEGLKLFFYRPYTKDLFNDYEKNQELKKILEIIKDVSIKNVKVQYASNKIYFCPLKQLVDNASECKGEILDISSGSSIFHVCTDSRHKIGDDILTGGFFTEQAAIDSCHEFRECKPSYRHYQNMTATQMFKTTIGCVDSPDNPSCTDNMCKAYFADYETMPINEVVIQNDHTRIATIRSKVVQKEVKRPKINYSAEASGLVDPSDTTFLSEMKDKAFEYMVNNASYDKVEYVLGKPSPRKIAFAPILGDGGTIGTKLLMKAQSDLYDINNPYYYYTIIEVEQEWRPAFGLFYSDTGYLSAGSGDVSFHDITYISIPQMSEKVPKVFFRNEYAKIKQKSRNMVCGSGDQKQVFKVPENAVPNSNCRIATTITYPEYIAIDKKEYLSVNRNLNSRYINNSGALIHEPWQNNNFKSDNPIRTVFSTTSLVKLVRSIGGVLIKDQKRSETSSLPEKLYYTNEDSIKRGNIYNIKVHVVRTDHKLNNKDLSNSVKSGLFEVYNMLNPTAHRSNINEDGIFNNKIRLMKYGPIDKTTLESDITPRFFENGKNVFKFLFVKPPEVDKNITK